ncbi:hypothetical protein M409DRAFT_19455 [Zasmidium cellare ATCC 36951]|uniref:NACHT-NTPase and P-loop NTPases N-terminal domain-containing protein n=1 Tax=Zasmidium cellare ATCC 36951 TaxID=1080233 RepID=A0A6A6CWR3_ZASCE|nr:uncharacterized protein M409DRAFT_19455 [Zasmidium cellare ATCC 36951]KAF2170640.1 hypothetical protein M409DRAFT_19455 [Zasmidium cellare ATCC 36951]
MAEAGAILGTISAIISLIDAAKKVYDAVGDARGLPEAFRLVASNLPLVHAILEKIQAQYRSAASDGHDIAIIAEALEDCRDKADSLKKIFVKVLPGDKDSWVDRYKSALRTIKPGRADKVEKLMETIMDKLQLLQEHSIADNLTGGERRQLKKGIDSLEKVEPSISDEGVGGSLTQYGQGSNAATGHATQTNNQNFGSGNTYQPQQDSLIQANLVT